MPLSRRLFLRRAATAAAASALPFQFTCGQELAFAPDTHFVADANGLNLPPGFVSRLLQTRGDQMSDGNAVPASPDGMGAFPAPNGGVILMRNHELDPAPAEDNAPGGVTRVVLDANWNVVSSSLVLTNTNRNCAGGVVTMDGQPYWASCEEPNRPDPAAGFVYLCPVAGGQAQRMDQLGQFRHEAAAFEPRTKTWYLTEDRREGGAFYRHTAARGLEALMVTGQANANLSANWTTPGQSQAISWVPIARPTGIVPEPRTQGFDQGAASITKAEGLWIDAADGSIYFASSDGGAANKGQVFRLNANGDGGTLTLVASARSEDIMTNPDNLTVAPSRNLFLVEDNKTAMQRILRMSPTGVVSEFGNKPSEGELAGICFSPDGRAMFVNLYDEGTTLVIYRNDGQRVDV